MLTVHSPVTAANARRVLAAALLAACAAAWPSLASAQQSDGSAASSVSTNGSPGASNDEDDDSDQPAAVRRAHEDEQRLLGGPSPAQSPYDSDDPSPQAQEDALMNEQRMTVVSPSEFYSSPQPGAAAAGADGSGSAIRRFGQLPDGAGPQDKPGAPKRYDYSAGGSSSPVYRNPYETQSSTGQAYRSPW